MATASPANDHLKVRAPREAGRVIIKSPADVFFRANRTLSRHRRMTDADHLHMAAHDFRSAKALFA